MTICFFLKISYNNLVITYIYGQVNNKCDISDIIESYKLQVKVTVRFW